MKKEELKPNHIVQILNTYIIKVVDYLHTKNQ